MTTCGRPAGRTDGQCGDGAPLSTLRPMKTVTRPDLSPVVDLLTRQAEQNLHDCAQVYVSRHGDTILDGVVGESRPGRPLRNRFRSTMWA